jgi:hypothetical protein
VGLFDQFDDDFLDEADPWSGTGGPAARPAEPDVPATDDDLWGTPAPAPRRPIDPLINDGDFW